MPASGYCLVCFAALPPTDGVRLGAKCPECGRRDVPGDRLRYRSLNPVDLRCDRIARAVWFLGVLPAVCLAFPLNVEWWLLQPGGGLMMILITLLSLPFAYGGRTARFPSVQEMAPRKMDLFGAAGFASLVISESMLGLWTGSTFWAPVICMVLAPLCVVAHLPSRGHRALRRLRSRFDPVDRRLRERGLLES